MPNSLRFSSLQSRSQGSATLRASRERERGWNTWEPVREREREDEAAIAAGEARAAAAPPRPAPLPCKRGMRRQAPNLNGGPKHGPESVTCSLAGAPNENPGSGPGPRRPRAGHPARGEEAGAANGPGGRTAADRYAAAADADPRANERRTTAPPSRSSVEERARESAWARPREKLRRAGPKKFVPRGCVANAAASRTLQSGRQTTFSRQSRCYSSLRKRQ